MKHFPLLPILALAAFAFIPYNSFSKNYFREIDSTIIDHELDGTVGEWPADKFELDKTTNIKYAVDNDAKNLFIAMMIPDHKAQMKIISNGMELYIDTKGKKREGKGIKFPVKVVSMGGGQMHDIQQMRTTLAPNLLSLQLLGFTDQEATYQEILRQGSANIQFSWDDKNIMYIEYSIPFNLLGDYASLSNKNISLGWKIKEAEAQIVRKEYTSTTKLVSVQSGTGGPLLTSGIRDSNQSAADNKIKEHSFWTKYMVSPLK